MDQGGQVRPELDTAVMQTVCLEPSKAGAVRAGLKPGNFFPLFGSAVEDQTLVASQPLLVKMIKIGAKVVRSNRYTTYAA